MCSLEFHSCDLFFVSEQFEKNRKSKKNGEGVQKNFVLLLKADQNSSDNQQQTEKFF